MTSLKSDYHINWGPYSNIGEATFCLTTFTNAALGPDIGIAYCDDNGAVLLRPPTFGKDGIGYGLVARWLGPVTPPPPPPPPPGFMERIIQNIENSIVTAVNERAQIVQAQQAGELTMINSMQNWLNDPTHDHAVGLVGDVLGIASFAMLFVPLGGEVEATGMGIFKAAKTAWKAQNYLKATAFGTAIAGFAGTICSSISDLRYFQIYKTDGSAAADQFGNSKLNQILSISAAAFSLTDLAVGGLLLIKDIPKDSKEIVEQSTKAVETDAQSNKLSVAAARWGNAATQTNDAALTARLASVSAYANTRAKTLAAQAIDLDKTARAMNARLWTTIAVNGTATFGMTPYDEAMFDDDAVEKYKDHVPGPEQWVGRYLDPAYLGNKASSLISQALGLHIVAVQKTNT